MSVFLTDVNSKKQVPKTLIRNAIREDDPEKLKEALVQYKSGTDFDPNELNESLLFCTKSEKYKLIPVLAEYGADINFGEFRTPLQWALMLNKEESVRYLVKSGADINYGDPPPVVIAASLGRLNSMKLLLEMDVDLSAEDSDHRTAIDLAITYQHNEIANLLTEKGCISGDRAIKSHYK